MMKRLSIAAAACLVFLGTAISPVYGDTGVPPVLTKSWVPNHSLPGGTVQIRFDMWNPGTNAALTGVAFSDVLPAGLSVGNIGATAIACGTVSATAPSTINYTNGTLNPNLSPTACNFSINITTSTEGVYTNTTSTISSNEGGSGADSTAILTVGLPPTIVKSFGAATVGVTENVSLTFDISNPNSTVAANGLGFNDTLPAGLVVATPSGATNSCGGTVTAVAGSGSIQLAGGSLAAGSNCSVALNVMATSTGVKNNSTQVTTTNLGNGNTTNTSITAVQLSADLSITKTDGVTLAVPGGALTYTVTVSNAGPDPALSSTVSDTLPASLTGNWTCVGAGGGTCTASGSGNINDTVNLPVGSSVTYTVSGTISPSATGTLSNTATVSPPGSVTDPNPSNNTATDSNTLIVETVQQQSIPTLQSGVTADLTVSGCTTIESADFVNAPSGAPAGLRYPFGLLDFSLSGCTSQVTVTVTYSQALPSGAVFYKEQNGIYATYTATLGSNSVTFTLTDNGTGDGNITLGTISDPSGIGVITAIPTLSEWGLILLSALIALLAFGVRRNRLV